MSHNNPLNTPEFESKIELFKQYLDRTGMEHKQYQMDGIRWCLNNELRRDPPANVRGGFIADEMGLGKTILMIGLCVTNFSPSCPTLIVVPPVLLDQWFLQIFKTTGHKALIYHGEEKKTADIEKLRKSLIVITTYNAISLTKQNLKDGKVGLLHEVTWKRVIFDEAHHIRNKNTIKFNGAKFLKSSIRWLVSGTPIQNKKQDFYTLCSALKMPASFYTDPENLITIAKCFILKRTKAQVGIELPEIHIQEQSVNWQNNKEKELSQEIHAALSFSKTTTKNTFIAEAFKKSSLSLLLRAKQSCVLPKLMLEKLQQLYDGGLISSFDYYKEAFEYSSKLDSVIDCIVSNKGNGKGKLIFCHYRDEIDTVATRLREKGMNVASFDGRTSNGKRYDILNDAYEVIILQIQTGCEGLNLQENYSEIYFVSPHWNPAVEDQAIARCHRIGQKNKVNVFRFQMSNFVNPDSDVPGITIDKYVSQVQEVKRVIADDIIQPTN
jgi:SNF2 family DNA or RNA helicase